MTGRRIFINNGEQFFQIFRFEQKSDGSIITWWPDFSNSQWLAIINNEDSLAGISVKSEGDGKLNIHGCGIATFRSHKRPKDHSLIIKGNSLLDKEKKIVGARHLLSAFIKKPFYLPNSPAFKRKSDYSIKANEELAPFIIMFFAIPQSQTGLKINFNFSLPLDEMNKIPGDMLGGDLFPLRYHDIFWFAYRTKHINWPKNTLICYDDGYKVPVFVVIGKGQLKLKYRMPEYLLKDGQFTIKCDISNS